MSLPASETNAGGQTNPLLNRRGFKLWARGRLLRTHAPVIQDAVSTTQKEKPFRVVTAADEGWMNWQGCV
jgi:hypothetical protein